MGMAYIAQQRGKREEALEWYQRVLRQDPTNTIATSAVLTLDTRLDSSAASLKARDLAEREPDSVAALTTAANTLVASARVAEALPLFARAQMLEPENPLHAYNHAVALDRLGQVQQAVAQYLKVVQMTENQLPVQVRPFSIDVIRQRLAELQQSATTMQSNP
jgi:tetratricopeptide (TPR) repeat protein